MESPDESKTGPVSTKFYFDGLTAEERDAIQKTLVRIWKTFGRDLIFHEDVPVASHGDMLREMLDATDEVEESMIVINKQVYSLMMQADSEGLLDKIMKEQLDML